MNATDLALAVGIAGAAAVGLAVLPLGELQGPLWVTAFLAVVVGDSATTSLIRRYDCLEEGGPATRRACGPNPSPRCAVATRLLFFGAAVGLYALVMVGGAARVGVVGTAATAFPLILTVAGTVVVVWNVVEVVAAERRRPPPIERL